MPPQVNGAGPGRRPAAVHSQDGVDQTKSSNVDKKASESQTSEPHRATSKEKSQKKLEMSMGGTWFTELAKALGEAQNNKAQKVKTQAEVIKRFGKDFEKMEQLKGYSQEMSAISGAFNEAVKTIGNAVSDVAKKQ